MLVLLALLALGLVLPLSAGAALKVEVVNPSGHEDAHLTVVGGDFDVEGDDDEGHALQNDVPGPLGKGVTFTINKLVAGRIYISYGEGVTNSVNPEISMTRYDWIELNVHPVDADVANLTAVDQFGIGMRLDTYNAAEEHLEGLGSANSHTIFDAMQQIPGGPEAIVRGAGNEIIRVLAPNKTDVYPPLDEYVRSMSGQTIHLGTAFFGTPFVTSSYGGTFGADGSIVLHGTSNPPGEAPPQISFQGDQLINDIYTGDNTPNTLEGAIRRDVLAAFSIGLWGGRYGNNALDFCSDPNTTAQGTWCPKGFNKPAFGDARQALSPFPTCERYAAVINQHSDSYGNPYSDASKKVTVPVVKSENTGEPVDRLKITVQPDSGNAQPEASGNPNCGAAAPAPASSPDGSGRAAAAAASAAAPRVRALRLFRKAWVKGRQARVGRVACAGSCGRVKLIAKKGRRALGRGRYSLKGTRSALTLRLTKLGKRVLSRRHRIKVRLAVWVAPPGGKAVRRQQTTTLIERSSRKRHRRHR